jgi:hypothetical protein
MVQGGRWSAVLRQGGGGTSNQLQCRHGVSFLCDGPAAVEHHSPPVVGKSNIFIFGAARGELLRPPPAFKLLGRHSWVSGSEVSHGAPCFG